MLRILTLAVAIVLVLAMSPGRSDEPKPQGDKRAQGIQAEVRGTLQFEHGHGYFITVKPADKAESEMRVWLRSGEDKALVRQMQELSGKEVSAKGELAQMPATVHSAVPPMGMYLRHGFTIEPGGAK
jgi:hypothetical protein